MPPFVPWAPTDVLTAARLNAQPPVGAFELFVPANAFWPWSAAPCGEATVLVSPTWGASYIGLPFDPLLAQTAAALVALPAAVDGGAAITAQVYFTNTAGLGGIVHWTVTLGAAGHGEFLGDVSSVTHALDGVAGPPHTPAQTPLVLGGGVSNAGPQRLTQILLGRQALHAADTYPAFAYLLGLKLWVQTTEVNDA